MRTVCLSTVDQSLPSLSFTWEGFLANRDSPRGGSPSVSGPVSLLGSLFDQPSEYDTLLEKCFVLPDKDLSGASRGWQLRICSHRYVRISSLQEQICATALCPLRSFLRNSTALSKSLCRVVRRLSKFSVLRTCVAQPHSMSPTTFALSIWIPCVDWTIGAISEVAIGIPLS